MKGALKKGGPSIAVMLGAPREGDVDDESAADLSLSETKARAEDAATVFADAVEGKDAARIVKAFCALQTLCGHLDELEDAGESEEPEVEEVEERPEE